MVAMYARVWRSISVRGVPGLRRACQAVMRANRNCAEGSPATETSSVPLQSVHTRIASGLPNRQSWRSFVAARAPAEQRSERTSAVRRTLRA